MVYEPVGLSTFVVARTRPCHTGGLDLYVCVLAGKCDASTHTYRSGRQAVVSAGRRSVAAVAVAAGWYLSPSCYFASASVAVVRQSIAVAAVASVVAAIALLVALLGWLSAASYPRCVASLALRGRCSPLRPLVGGPHGWRSSNAPLNFERRSPFDALEGRSASLRSEFTNPICRAGCSAMLTATSEWRRFASSMASNQTEATLNLHSLAAPRMQTRTARRPCTATPTPRRFALFETLTPYPTRTAIQLAHASRIRVRSANSRLHRSPMPSEKISLASLGGSVSARATR